MSHVEAMPSKDEIKQWERDMIEHRNGFLVTDRNSDSVAAFMRELDVAQNLLNAIVKALKGNETPFSLSSFVSPDLIFFPLTGF